jgi:hypothetical protein
MNRFRRGLTPLLVASFSIALGACSKRPPQAAPAESVVTSSEPAPTAAPAAERAITKLYPATARVGRGFNVQVDGRSAIAVKGTGFTQNDKICWNGQVLKTVFGYPDLLTAGIPQELLKTPGEVTVSIRDSAGSGASEPRATFRITE